MKMALHLYDLLSQNPEPESNPEQNVRDKFQLRDILQNTWPGLINIKSFKRRISLKNCQKLEVPQEIWQYVYIMWYPE